MKEKTNIECPKCGKKKMLDKEYWGQDRRQLPEWKLTCIKCGFGLLVSTDDLNKYQYFGRIVKDV